MSDITKADVANFVAALEKWSEGRSEKERKLLFFTLGQAAKSTKEGAAPRTPEVTGFRAQTGVGPDLTAFLQSRLNDVVKMPGEVLSWWGHQGQVPGTHG